VDGPPPLSGRERALGLVAGLWMITGLFLDGWAHDDNRVESFFTPWHAVLYSGFVVAATLAVRVVVVRRTGSTWRSAVPPGHGLSLAALAVFAAAATGDLLWHEVFGIEVGVEALLSPTHLALLGSGLVMLSAPLRAAWSDERSATTLRGLLPVVLDLALLAAVAGFFLVITSVTVNDVGEVPFARAPNTPHEHPAQDPAELLQLLGVASVLVTSMVVALAVHVLWSRPPIPSGAVVLLMTLIGLSHAALDQFEDPWIVAAALVGGIAAEALAQRVARWVAAAAGIVVLWLTYFLTLELDGDGLRWTAELWVGTSILAGLLVAAVGLAVRGRAAVALAPTHQVTVRPRHR